MNQKIDKKNLPEKMRLRLLLFVSLLFVLFILMSLSLLNFAYKNPGLLAERPLFAVTIVLLLSFVLTLAVAFVFFKRFRNLILEPIYYVTRSLERKLDSQSDELVQVTTDLQRETSAKFANEIMLKGQREAISECAYLIEADLKGVVSFVNPKFCETSGYLQSEIVGSNLEVLSEQQNSKQYVSEFWSQISSGKIWRGEFRYLSRTQSTFWVQWAVVPVMNPEGEIQKYVGVGLDITEKKGMEQLKDEFLSSVSHEIRTPLTIIMTSIHNFSDGIMGELNDAQKRVVEICRRNCDRLNRLISDLLELSRLESGKTVMNFQEHSVDHLLKGLVDEFAGLASEKELKLDSSASEALIAVYDEDMINQILNNLIQNALRYARTGVSLQAFERGDSIEFVVSDDGPGIKKEDQEKLFSKFTQINRKMGGAGYKGTGLGLAICLKIVESHHGKIWVVSDVDQGAEFHVLLPIRQEIK